MDLGESPTAAPQTTLCVNGECHDVVGSDGTPLLWVLRDLGMVSAKYGCGAGQCGACRVLVAGTPTASCQLPLGAVGDAAVITHEGLQGDQVYERVVAALLRHNAGQCGYCLPGIALALLALARRSEPVPRAELLGRLDEHLCRCGSHPRILRAATELLEDGHGFK